MAELNGQVFETKLEGDMYYQCFDEYEEWGKIAGFEEGSWSKVRGSEIERVLCEITKLRTLG